MYYLNETIILTSNRVGLTKGIGVKEGCNFNKCFFSAEHCNRQEGKKDNKQFTVGRSREPFGEGLEGGASCEEGLGKPQDNDRVQGTPPFSRLCSGHKEPFTFCLKCYHQPCQHLFILQSPLFFQN